MDPTTPFEWSRIFWGVEPPVFLLEIAFRVLVIYVCAGLLLRMAGKRSRRQMTSFDLLILIALGSAIGDALFYPEVPIVYAVVVTATVVILNNVTGSIQARSPGFQDFVTGTATKVVENGRVLEPALRHESLSRDELFSLLRERGVSDTGQVKAAYLELSGDLGVIRYPDGEAGSGESTMPGSSG